MIGEYVRAMNAYPNRKHHKQSEPEVARDEQGHEVVPCACNPKGESAIHYVRLAWAGLCGHCGRYSCENCRVIGDADPATPCRDCKETRRA